MDDEKDMKEKQQEQSSVEKLGGSTDRNKKRPGMTLMIVISIVYIIMCGTLFISTILSNEMFSEIGAVFVLILGPVGFGIIWGIYIAWLFLYKRFSKSRAKYPGIKSFIIVASIIFIFLAIKIWGPRLFYSIKSGIEESKISKKGTISSVEKETVCIKEKNDYVPYVVADNKYAFTKNSLLVRKNALNKKLKYHKLEETDDNGLYIYNKYDNSLIDEYLTSDEWLSRFDKDFLNVINNTVLYQNYSFKDYKISRKFFIISTYEYDGFHSAAEWDKMALSGGRTADWSYYSTEDNVYDDDGNIVDYWIVRIDDQNNDLYKCNSKGCWLLKYNDNSEYNFRPAFTISNDTKIVKNNSSKYGCKWFIDINNK